MRFGLTAHRKQFLSSRRSIFDVLRTDFPETLGAYNLYKVLSAAMQP